MDNLVLILLAIIVIMFVIYGHSTTTPEQKEVYLVRQMYWPWWNYGAPQYRHIPYYRHRMLDPRPLQMPHLRPPITPPITPHPTPIAPITPPRPIAPH